VAGARESMPLLAASNASVCLDRNENGGDTIIYSFSKREEKCRLFFAIGLIDGQSIRILDTESCLIGLRVNLPQSARILRSHTKARRDLPFSLSFGNTFLVRSEEALVVWYRVRDN
jgi:hypothetical protein